MQNLLSLDLSNNEFVEVPVSVYTLKSLLYLDLKRNTKLEKLHPDIVNMTNLKSVELDFCSSLVSPPHQVWSRGIQSIRQYYHDLSQGIGHQISAATVAVLGRTKAGKTSLIKTLQKRKRELTKRTDDMDTDESTRVFNVEEVVTQGATLRFLDLGGHEIYHNTYQLALKDSCIPVVVVNLRQYNHITKSSSPIEAVRTLFFDWMAHIFVSNPAVEVPRVVFTHRDRFKDDECERMISEFLRTTEELRQILVEEEAGIGGVCSQIKQFSSPIITWASVFYIGNEKSYESDIPTYDKLLSWLKQSCSRFTREIPQVWELVDLTLQSTGGPFVLFSDLLRVLKQKCNMEEKQLGIILDYLHHSGKILWYSDHPELRPYVFHRIFQVARALNVVLDEYSSEMWERRLRSFKPFHTSTDRRVEKEEFEEMCKVCDETGLMNETLLEQLIKTESALSTLKGVAAALALLKSFNLIHGPVSYKQEPCYVIPFYVRDYFDDGHLSSTNNTLRLRAELSFKGLAPPAYLYNTTSMRALQLYRGDSESFSVKANGVHIYHDDIDIMLTHDSKSQKSTIEVASDPENASKMWSLFLQKLTIMSDSAKAWVSGRYVITMFCSHCLLKGDMHPAKEVNPKWHTGGGSYDSASSYMMCKGDRKVPSCLKIPCKYVADPMDRYLSSLSKQLLRLCIIYDKY